MRLCQLTTPGARAGQTLGSGWPAGLTTQPHPSQKDQHEGDWEKIRQFCDTEVKIGREGRCRHSLF